MPLRGDILSSSYSPQVRNFDNSTGSSKLKGGITEYIQAEYEVRVFWYLEPTSFSVFNSGGEIRLNDGKSFLSNGFEIGESLTLQFNFGIDGQSGEGVISAISEDGSTVFSDMNTLTDGDYDSATQEALIVGKAELTTCVYGFGLIENKESFNIFSKLTGEQQLYNVSGLESNNPEAGIVFGTPKSWASNVGGLTIQKLPNSNIPINRGADFGGVGGVPTPNTVQNYKIIQKFPVLPFYLAGGLSNLENKVKPSFLAGQNSLKHVFQSTFKKNLSDEETNKRVTFQSLDGSIGYFEENFNGQQSQYSPVSIAYDVGGQANPSLLASGVTSVTAIVSSDNGTFDGTKNVVVNHSYLPPNEEDYINTSTFFEENFAFESIEKDSSGNIVKNVTTTLIDANNLQIDFDIDTTAVLPELTEESNYILSVVLDDTSLSSDSSDRTVVEIDINTYDKDPDIPDLLLVDNAVTYDHVTDDTNTGFTDYKGWVQDGYEAKGSFRLDRSKFAFLNSLFIELVAWKDGTNDFFTIQSNSYNLTGAVIDGDGNQQINIETTQGFKLDELDQFNKKDLTTGVFDGTFISYEFAMGLKINWQDWLSLPDADNVFVDSSEPNNGLNQNSSRYSLKEGYTLQTILRAEVLETQQNVVTDYIHKIPMVVNDFEEDAAEDWEAVITTQIDETLEDANGSILGSGESTRIIATFTPQFALTPDPNNFEGIIRIVEQLPQGDKTIYELSSIRSSQANNLLIPLDGEALTKVSVVGSSVVLECRTDASLVQDVNYTVSARLFGPAGAVIVGDYNDDFSNDFFV